MQAPLKVKVSGTREEVERVILTLEADWECRATSQFIDNQPEMGCHIFIALLPKKED